MHAKTSFAPLGKKPFRLMFTARLISGCGNGLIPVTLAFAVLQSGGGATGVGEVLTAEALAQVVAMPIGGVWSDRLPRRLVMLWSDAVQALAYALLAIAVCTGHAALWQYMVVAAVGGAGWAFFAPAGSGIVPELVEPAQLQQANALLGLTDSSTSIFGPALAGVLVATAGPGTALVADAVSFVLSVLFTAGVRVPRAAEAEARESRFLADLHEGWRELRMRPWYLANVLADGVFNFAVAFLLVLGPAVMEAGHGGAKAWGVVAAAQAGGAVIGGLFALRFMPRRPFLAADLAAPTAALPLILLAFLTPVPVLAVGTAVGFAVVALCNEIKVSVQQQIFPGHVLSRISALDWMISLTCMPIGYATAAPIAHACGTRAALIAAAVLLAVPFPLMALSPGVRAIRRREDGSIGSDTPAEGALRTVAAPAVSRD